MAKQMRTKLNQFMLFKNNYNFLKISVDLQTALVAETHPAEYQ
jgi:hypothetical protein